MCLGTSTDPDPLQVKYDSLQQEYQRLLEENRKLKETIQKERFSYTNLSDSDLSALTGVNSMAAFLMIVNMVSKYMRPVKGMALGNMVLLVLMKLRLNLTNKDLSLRFKISPSKVSRILGSYLPALAARLKVFIQWPSKNKVLKNMPKVFRNKYKKCRVIIDCSEVFIQRPSNLEARAQTWSNYKHHNTMKFLVGISPYGSISFLSKCFGGRISDKEVTEQSGFYDKLEIGDLVLADRGFLIADELAARGVTLAVPAFAKGKLQFSQREIETSRRLSKARIHVERAIERIKRFHILKQTMPISLLPHSDAILTICASLTNLMPKLVK